MKKVKIMLMSILLLAVVGGALAFKAKYTADFCTTLARQSGSNFFCTNASGAALTCPNLVENKTTDGTSGPIYCTAASDGTDCSPAPNCINATKQIRND